MVVVVMVVVVVGGGGGGRLQDPTIKKSETYHDPATDDPEGQNVTPYVPGRPFVI